MPKPTTNWICIAFGGTNTRIAFYSMEYDSPVEIVLPTLFHVSETEHEITSGKRVYSLLDEDPEGIILLDPNSFEQKRTIWYGKNRNSIDVVELLTEFFRMIKGFFEMKYFNEQSIDTCFLVLPHRRTTLHRFLHDAAKNAGFSNIKFCDFSIGIVTAWAQHYNCATPYLLLCDLGGYSTNFTYLEKKYHGFQRISGTFSHFEYGASSIENSIFTKFRDMVAKQNLEEDIIDQWNNRANAYKLCIRKKKELFFENGEFDPMIKIRKAKILLKEHYLQKSAETCISYICDYIKKYIEKYNKYCPISKTSLLITGGGSSLPGIEQKIRQYFNGKIYIASPKEASPASGAVWFYQNMDVFPLGKDDQEKLFFSIYQQALMGDPSAEYQVAKCYAKGRGVPISVEESAYWFEQAADHGIEKAMRQIASYYEKGLGVFPDLQKAKAFREKATLQMKTDKKNKSAAMLPGNLTNVEDREASTNSDWNSPVITPTFLKKRAKKELMMKRKNVLGQVIAAVLCLIIFLLGIKTLFIISPVFHVVSSISLGIMLVMAFLCFIFTAITSVQLVRLYLINELTPNIRKT